MTELFLSNALVARHFGKTPSKGRRIRGHTLRSNCGVRFAAAWGKGSFVPHEMTVDMVISLHWVKGNNRNGLWEVHTNKGYEQVAIDWLIENCQTPLEKQPPAPSVKQRSDAQ